MILHFIFDFSSFKAKAFRFCLFFYHTATGKNVASESTAGIAAGKNAMDIATSKNAAGIAAGKNAAGSATGRNTAGSATGESGTKNVANVTHSSFVHVIPGSTGNLNVEARSPITWGMTMQKRQEHRVAKQRGNSGYSANVTHGSFPHVIPGLTGNLNVKARFPITWGMTMQKRPEHRAAKQRGNSGYSANVSHGSFPHVIPGSTGNPNMDARFPITWGMTMQKRQVHRAAKQRGNSGYSANVSHGSFFHVIPGLTGNLNMDARFPITWGMTMQKRQEHRAAKQRGNSGYSANVSHSSFSHVIPGSTGNPNMDARFPITWGMTMQKKQAHRVARLHGNSGYSANVTHGSFSHVIPGSTGNLNMDARFPITWGMTMPKRQEHRAAKQRGNSGYSTNVTHSSFFHVIPGSTGNPNVEARSPITWGMTMQKRKQWSRPYAGIACYN